MTKLGSERVAVQNTLISYAKQRLWDKNNIHLSLSKDHNINFLS